MTSDLTNKNIQLALQHYYSGNLQEAEHLLINALKTLPDDADILHLLGVIYAQLNNDDLAMQYLEKSLLINPANGDACFAIGILMHSKGRLDEGLNYFRKAIAVNPNNLEAHNYIGNILQSKGELDEAIIYYKKASMIDPNFAEAYFNLGNVQHFIGKHEEALAAFNKAIEIKPDFTVARWAKCISQLPIIYPDLSSIEDSRKRYHEELIKLASSIPLETPQDIENAAGAIGVKQPFYLAYQGLNDRELQQIYGNLVCRIMSLRYPQYANQLDMPEHLSKGPFRVGIVSGYFYRHSVWKLFKGWVQNLDEQRFSLYGYYTGAIRDNETEVARQSFTRFVENMYSFEGLCETIRNDNLDVLIYPEIGMDWVTLRLAALRLAPVQCASWGHPDTSGLPTIDYFFSSGLMEPPDGDDHYTEKLIRLPNLSIYYTPLDFPTSNVNRQTFRLREKSILYLCCQSLSKYLPQYDEVFPRIAGEVNDCQFLFISNKSTYVTEQFRQRIYRSFDKFGLRADDYIVFLPQLDMSQYNAINALSDVYLDSIGWSGGNTTLEALAFNLPIVTLPCNLMRSCHSAAILSMMGVTDTITKSFDEYIKIAVELGKDAEWRQYISQKILKNKHQVYRDKTSITALGDFLEEIIKNGIITKIGVRK